MYCIVPVGVRTSLSTVVSVRTHPIDKVTNSLEADEIA